MSGQQIGTAVGFVAGFFLPGGPQVWAGIGGMVGGVISPTVIKGPSIGDAQRQTTQAGAPRPVVYGHPAPFSGNIIDGEPIARKITVEEDGKGGPVVEQEKFLLTSAIRICEGPIAGVVRIWRNGTVVYDRRTDDAFPEWEGGDAQDRQKYISEIRAQSSKFEQDARIYLGTEDQLPDPALEAIHGVGNTPYYRGTAYIVIEDDDVTNERGAAAQWQFEVMSVGTDIPAGVVAPSQTLIVPSQSNSDEQTELMVNIVDIPIDGDMGLLFQVYEIDLWMINRFVVQPLYGPTTGQEVPIPLDQSASYVSASGVWDSGWLVSSGSQAEIAEDEFEIWCSENGVGMPGLNPTPVVPQYFSLPTAARGIRVITMWFPGTAADAVSGSIQIKTPDVDGVTGTVTPELPNTIMGSDGLLYTPDWAAANGFNTLEDGSVTLSYVVEDIASRCGVPASKLDVSPLNDIIPGFLVAVQSPGADCIRPTQQMFFFDMPEYDGKIRAVRRGAASIGTITEDEMLEAPESDIDTRAQAVEFPLKVSVVTQDPAADYAAVPQTSSRYSGSVVALGETTITSPIPFGADEAMRRADIIHKVLWARAEGKSEFDLPEEWTRLVPSDCFDRDGRRWLIEKADYADGAVHLEAVYDRASNYTSNATGRPAPVQHLPVSGLRGPTVLAAMNLPPLRAQDNVPGAYLAATGIFAGWDGCTVQMSIDGGVTYRTVATILRRSVMGELVEAITATTEPIVVMLHDGELHDVSSDQIVLGFNAFALAPDLGLSEVAQFQNVDETSSEEHELTDVTRGLLGTESTDHSAGESFVMLSNALFLPIDASLYGTILYFRAVTNGTVPEDNQVIPFLYQEVVNIVPNYILAENGDHLITEAGDRLVTE